MFKSGLLVLTLPIKALPSKISPIISLVLKDVKETLYVQFAPDSNSTIDTTSVDLAKQTSSVIKSFYTETSLLSNSLDLRVLLPSPGSDNNQFWNSQRALNKPPSVIIIDNEAVSCSTGLLIKKIKTHFLLDDKIECKSLSVGSDLEERHLIESEVQTNRYDNVVLGGTFDVLHTGHKLLLSEACQICKKRLTVGITDGPMIKKKTLMELMLPLQDRVRDVRGFLEDIAPNLEHNLVTITDPYGPSIEDPQLQCVVVSKETHKGALSINEKRRERSLNQLEIITIDLFCNNERLDEAEEDKVSSSTRRFRELGTLLRQPEIKKHNQFESSVQPYIIGITGGIACGKTSICKRISQFGVQVINCDNLGHQTYLKNTECYKSIVKEFGVSIIGEDGEINRKNLGAIVFSNKDKMNKLNMIVWPEIKKKIQENVKELVNQGSRIIVLEAAVLLEANWQDMTNEIWVCFIPREEAIQRIMTRNNLTQEEAESRIDSQISNKERIDKSNVVLSTLWSEEVTQRQIEKAWSLLLKRLPKSHF